MPDKWINWELLSNPYNWLVIWGSLAVLMIVATVFYGAMKQS